jgi:hypothetical protein
MKLAKKTKMIIMGCLATMLAMSQSFAFVTYDSATGAVTWDLSSLQDNIMPAIIAAAALFGLVFSITWGIKYVKGLVASAKRG